MNKKYIPYSELESYAIKARKFQDTLETEEQKEAFREFAKGIAYLIKNFMCIEFKDVDEFIQFHGWGEE